MQAAAPPAMSPAPTPLAPEPVATQAAIPTSSGEPMATIEPDVGTLLLLPNEDAPYTTGDTARLSGGEFVGDQADLTVLEAIQLPPAENGNAQFAFLVEIRGLDDATFPYNLLDFRLIDEQAFQYDALSDGGEEPRLEFGDLAPDQKVRGWLTFEVSEPTTTVQLEYAPALALEPATFGFFVP